MDYFIYQNEIAPLYVCASTAGLVNLTFNKNAMHTDYVFNIENVHIAQTIVWLDAYFNKKIDKNGHVKAMLPNFDIKHNTMLDAINSVKFGNTAYYGEIITPKYAQAIGNACRNNPILIMIPCHRIISRNNKNIYQYMSDMHSNIKKRLFVFEDINIT